MQPQDAQPQQQIMGNIAPAAAMGQQVIIMQNKSGGPKVFGILAILLGALGLLAGLASFGTDTEGLGGTITLVVYVSAFMNVASSGLFVYAGLLLMKYQRKGVWMGFAAVGIAVLSTVIQTLIVAKAVSDALGDGEAGGILAGLGLAMAGVQAVCCSMIIALPLIMNGADLE
tara:strand:+ start:298 stop:813 length:516 start_codon:yes stop_codon:yes gene_type:complete